MSLQKSHLWEAFITTLFSSILGALSLIFIKNEWYQILLCAIIAGLGAVIGLLLCHLLFKRNSKGYTKNKTYGNKKINYRLVLKLFQFTSLFIFLFYLLVLFFAGMTLVSNYYMPLLDSLDLKLHRWYIILYLLGYLVGWLLAFGLPIVITGLTLIKIYYPISDYLENKQNA
jgi:hypothetical protein